MLGFCTLMLLAKETDMPHDPTVGLRVNQIEDNLISERILWYWISVTDAHAFAMACTCLFAIYRIKPLVMCKLNIDELDHAGLCRQHWMASWFVAPLLIVHNGFLVRDFLRT